MKIGIVGWGVEGQSAYRYFGSEHSYLIVNEHPHGDFPTPSDRIQIQHLATDRPQGITGQSADLSYLDNLDTCDKIIYTPTSYKNLQKRFAPDDPIWAKAKTNQHILFEEVKTKNVIGVTGTKGKGTTSTLITKMLEAAGKKVYLGGNIGVPVLDFARDVQADDWVVLELSNFQLLDFPYSPHIAVCLMIVPEHLDWHPDVEDYVSAKRNIFAHQTPGDIAIYYNGNQYSVELAKSSAGAKIPYYQKPGAFVDGDGQIAIGDPEVGIINKSEVKLLGEHNLQNICAAITVVWFTLSEVEEQTKLDAIQKVLTTFTGLEHRLEFVREINGVKYYDDSFGTTPETAIVALRSFAEPKIAILGGSDKGIPFDGLAKEVTKNNVRQAIVIGDTAPKISELLRQEGFDDIVLGLTSMKDIVDQASKIAQPGDVVLLSCGCASFGLFKDYKDRGNQFKQAVAELL